MTKLLGRIQSPADLKNFTKQELIQLAAEIRREMIEVISLNGGHLASSLGTVELTLALHRVFESPKDKIIWDVGHQSYAHKIITGRQARFATIRQYGGLSGFPDRKESPHDAFGAGHAGTSISAALGMALARDLNKENHHVIAVIGDGSLGAGMAFEAINHAGRLDTKLIVILNDNGMAISPSVGALTRILNQVRLNPSYGIAKSMARQALSHLPQGKAIWLTGRGIKQRLERVILPNAFWEELGFTYLGPLDGHNIKDLEAALIRARDRETKPIVIHAITVKGKGYSLAEADAIKYHGISPNNVKIGNGEKSFSEIFGNTLLCMMQQNSKIVAISPAMTDGTGLAKVADSFPDRVFDVGICEQHAVTLAAGLATQGFIPVVAIYSTFLQRAFDQIIHDVCLQQLPVVFAVDRAGIVGDDGKTHQGAFDVSYLRCIPNMVVAAAASGDELQQLLFNAIGYGRPVAIRYPRGNDRVQVSPPDLIKIPLGTGELLRTGKDLTILALGTGVEPALKAADILSKEGLECGVINARFAKPLDAPLILDQIGQTGKLVTIEENALCGGFGSAVMELLSAIGTRSIKIERIGLPDQFIEHGPQGLSRSLLGMDSAGIEAHIRASFPELFVVSKQIKIRIF